MDPLHELQETTRQPVRNLPTVVRPTRVAVTIAFIRSCGGSASG